MAGTTDIDLTTEPVGEAADGSPVMLADIWPTHEEVASVVESCVLPEMFQEQYDNVWQKNEKWNAIDVTGGELYAWNEDSTYIQEPPFFVGLKREKSIRSRRSPAPAAWRCWAIRLRPTISLPR